MRSARGVVSGDVAVNQGEGQRQNVGDCDPQQRIRRVKRKLGGIARNLDVRIERPEPGARQHQNRVEHRQPGGEEEEVGQHRPGLRRQQRPRAFA